MNDECLPEGTLTRDEYITMFSWSIEDAANATRAWLEHNNSKWLRSPGSQWEAIQNIEQCQLEYISGDKSTLLYAQHLCLMDNLPQPKWLQTALISAYREANQFKTSSWDDVFDKPFPKYTQLKAKQQKRNLRFSIHNQICEITKKDSRIPIDENLFEQVGNEFNIGKTLASEYYYDVQNNFIKKASPIAKELLKPFANNPDTQK